MAASGYRDETFDKAIANQSIGGQVKAGPQTQYEQICERVSKGLSALHGEISQLHNTLGAVLPGEGISGAEAMATDPRPPEHGSLLMGFMRHIEQELVEMRERVEFIRVRTPF